MRARFIVSLPGGCKRPVYALFFCALILTACGNNPDAGSNAALQVKILRIDLAASLELQAAIDLQLDQEVITALRNGIPIVISVELRLGKRYRYFAQELSTQSYHWTLRYLPLSERFTLEYPVTGMTRSYPRLTMLLDDLRQSNSYPFKFDVAGLSNGNFQLQIRARLNRLRLPAPLRLPALISGAWRLRDGWHTVLIPAASEGRGEA